jgi:glycogen operon protein
VSGLRATPIRVFKWKTGQYAGLIEKSLTSGSGITALLGSCLYQFDEQDALPGQSNYWGIQPCFFFAPSRCYSSRKTPLGPLMNFAIGKRLCTGLGSR